MPSGYEPFTDAYGRLGFVFTDEGGQTLIAVPSGEITHVWDDDAEGFVEAESGHVVDDLEFPYKTTPEADYGLDEDQLADFDSRLARAEAALLYGHDAAQGYADADDGDEYDDETFGDDEDGAAEAEEATSQMATIAKARGAPLLRSEERMILNRWAEDRDHGHVPNAYAALERAGAEGERLHDLDTRLGRTDWQVERLADLERDQRAQGLGEPDPPQRETANLDDRQERVDWMVDRLEGRVDHGEGVA